MLRTILAMLFCALFYSGSLYGQEIELGSPVAKPKMTEPIEDAERVLDMASGKTEKKAVQEETQEDVADEAASKEKADDKEADNDRPVTVSVNEQGELIGQANATVNGDIVPIEANITLVSGGVLLGKTIANEDGSFSFPNVSPGDYNIYGCASSYCGSRACTVVIDSSRSEPVQVLLDQISACGCNGYAEAPATSFNGGGFSGSGFGSGGGFTSSGGGFGGGAASGSGAAGGGGLLSRRGFRLLAVGGIATAIAVGSSNDDEVSPSE